MSNVTPLKVEQEYRIFPVAPLKLHNVWLEVEPFIQGVVDHGYGDITIQSTRNQLMAGELQLFCIGHSSGEIHAVFCTDVMTMESGQRILRVPIIGGVEMAGWEKAFIEAIRNLGRELMCDRVRGLGRPGWKRAWKKFGLHEVYTAYELETEQE